MDTSSLFDEVRVAMVEFTNDVIILLGVERNKTLKLFKDLALD